MCSSPRLPFPPFYRVFSCLWSPPRRSCCSSFLLPFVLNLPFRSRSSLSSSFRPFVFSLTIFLFIFPFSCVSSSLSPFLPSLVSPPLSLPAPPFSLPFLAPGPARADGRRSRLDRTAGRPTELSRCQQNFGSCRQDRSSSYSPWVRGTTGNAEPDNI